MPASPRLLVAMLGLAAISAGGTIGYVVLEGLPWGDALYLAIITISTVGYGDFVPVTPAGRAFTAGLIVTGVSIALYLFWVLGQHIVEGRLRELLQRTTMQRNIERLEDHVIICGYGRFGRVVVDELSASDLPICVIEIDPLLDAELSTRGLPYLIGSATSDEILERAGVARARAIVIGTSFDPAQTLPRADPESDGAGSAHGRWCRPRRRARRGQGPGNETPDGVPGSRLEGLG